jgi:Protein of unknown function (DUF3099)
VGTVPSSVATRRRSVEGVDRRRRHRTYFVLMGTCLLLILLAWNLVRLWSTTAAVVMSVLAALLPPVAAFVGNQGALDESTPPTIEDDRG